MPLASRTYTEQVGETFYEVTVTAPAPGSMVTLSGVVPEGEDIIVRDLDNIPVMVGDSPATVRALDIKECVTRAEVAPPRRRNEPAPTPESEPEPIPEPQAP